MLGLHSAQACLPLRGGEATVWLQCGLLTAVASLAEPRLWRGDSVAVASRLWSTGSIVVAHGLKLPQRMWDHPRSGMEIVSPALAGEFFTIEPTRKSQLRC